MKVGIIMENSKKYFTTGEFAKLCKVNKQTLIYYDNIGLLSPARKNTNGYRFYSIQQFELFVVIDLLKDLGMSLEEIQAYTETKSPTQFLQLMQLQKEKLVLKQKELEINERIINTKMKLMEEALQTDFQAITLETLPSVPLYLSNNIKDISDEGFVKVVSDFIDELYVLKLDTGFSIGGLTLKQEALAGDYSNYSYLYMKQKTEQKDVKYFHTARGNYLVGYHIGPEETIEQTYERMFGEIAALNLQLGECILEEYVYDYIVEEQEKDYVTKIMIHIKNKQEE